MERPKNNDAKVRTWLCTLNNPELTLEQVHQRTSAAYTVGQLEQGANGTLHLQFVQNFRIPRRLAHYKKYLPQAHCEPVLVDNGVDKYCMKQETRVDGPWEYGEKPILIEALSTLAGNGLIERTGDVLSTIATSPFGKAVLGVADAAALRTLLNVPSGNDYLRKDQNFADIPNLAVAQFNLGLKAAAFLPTDVDGGVPTIVNGKISPSLIDVNLELPPIPVPDEAARLALPDTTPLGTLVVQKTPAGRFFAGALPLSNPANWIDVTQSDLVLSVFGLTGAVDIVDLPVLPPASLDIGDYFVIYDTSAADHKRVTLQALKDALGVGASVAAQVS